MQSCSRVASGERRAARDSNTLLSSSSSPSSLYLIDDHVELAAMDEAARRALIEQGSEDAVTVNQRALVDKLLARYASEFTVFRELIQNAGERRRDWTLS